MKSQLKNQTFQIGDNNIQIDAGGNIHIQKAADVVSYNVKSVDPEKIFSNESGESVIELSGLVTDERADRSWAFAFYDKEGCSQPHHHNERTEDYLIIAGKAEVSRDGTEHILTAGQMITIYPGQIHQVKSIGEEDLQMIVRCEPAWIAEDQHFLHPARRLSR